MVNSTGAKVDNESSFSPRTSEAYTLDGRFFISGIQDRNTHRFDADTGEPYLIIRRKKGQAECVAYSPDGLQIATGGDSDLTLWDA